MKRVLVIGCGSIGQRHIRALLAIGGCNIAAYRTRKGHNRELPADILNRVVEFDEVESALSWKPTHLLISNPTSLHAQYLRLGLDAGIAVFVEKPLIDEMSSLATYQITPQELRDADGMVGYVLRFFQITDAIKKWIVDRQLGNVVAAYMNVGHYLPFWHPYEDYRDSYAARSDLGGGALRTLSHEIDLAHYLFGECEQVFARTSRLGELDMEVDDCTDVVSSHSLCKQVVVHLDFLSPNLVRNGRILFTEGSLEYDFPTNRMVVQRYADAENPETETVVDSPDRAYERQMTHFLRGESGRACRLADGVKIAGVIDACEMSSKEGRVVDVSLGW